MITVCSPYICKFNLKRKHICNYKLLNQLHQIFLAYFQYEAHNEELHNLNSKQNIIRMIKIKENKMGGSCSMNWETKNAYNILDEKSEWKWSPGRPTCRWEDININLKETGTEGTQQIHFALDRNHKRHRISWLAVWLLASQAVICCMELIS
jgi:hypothetical protein